MNTYDLEYELIDISLELPYELPGEESWLVREDGPGSSEKNVEDSKIVYDADGVPMGQSMPEIQTREKLIADFMHQWGNTHPERRVLNIALAEYIYVKGVSFIEAKEHSSKSYKSTRAVMILEDVLANAKPIKRVPPKPEDKNQQEFDHFLVMLYKHPDLGSIKLTVGVRKRTAIKVQYGISVLKPDQPIVDYSVYKRKKKKRSPRK